MRLTVKLEPGLGWRRCLQTMRNRRGRWVLMAAEKIGASGGDTAYGVLSLVECGRTNYVTILRGDGSILGTSHEG